MTLQLQPPSPGFGAPRTPGTPERASQWEEQEIRRHHHNAIGSLDELLHTAYRVRAELIEGGADSAYVSFITGGNALSRKAIDVERSLVALRHVTDGAVHRLAIAAQAAEESQP